MSILPSRVTIGRINDLRDAQREILALAKAINDLTIADPEAPRPPAGSLPMPPITFPEPEPLPLMYATDKIFELKFDGSDETTKLNNAFEEAANQRKTLYLIDKTVTIDGPTFSPGDGGVVMDVQSFGVPGRPGIYVRGDGYTALTFTGQPLNVKLAVYGTGQRANGVYFNNATFCDIQKLRVVEFDGFGVKIDKLWDSIVLDMSIEKCGNFLDWAFSANSAGDTTNMTRILRLQVEQSKIRAMLFDGGFLSCVVGNIHSERGIPAAGTPMWDFGGAGARFEGGRFSCLEPSDQAVMRLTGENTTYENFRVEGGIHVQLKGSPGNSTLTVNTPNFNGTTEIDNSGGGGQINVTGGTVVNLRAGVDTALPIQAAFDRVVIRNLNVGFCGNPSFPEKLKFNRCEVGVLTSDSTLSSAEFTDCEILEANDLLQYYGRFINCRIRSATEILINGGALMHMCDVFPNVRVASGSSLFTTGINNFYGNLAHNGNCTSILGYGTRVAGTVTGFGKPTKKPAIQIRADEIWRVGERTVYLTAGPGASPGGVCVTAGGDTAVWEDEAISGGGIAADENPTASTIAKRTAAADLRAAAFQADSQRIYLNTARTAYLNWDGTNFQLVGPGVAALDVEDLSISKAAVAGVVAATHTLAINTASGAGRLLIAIP